MKTYTHNLLSAAVVAAITFSGAAIADEYQTLETTTVTAGRFEQDLMETPMSVSVITADDIAKSGAQSIGALIESMTGVLASITTVVRVLSARRSAVKTLFVRSS